MKKIILLILIATSVNFIFGQEADPSVIFVKKINTGILITPDKNSGIEVNGTPYLDSTFTQGEFQIGSTNYLSLMRYDIYSDGFEVKQGDEIVYINSYAVDTVHCNKAKFVFKKADSRFIVYEFLSKNNNVEFLKKHNVTYNEGTIGKSKKKSKYPEFVHNKPIYYISSADKGMIKVDGLKGFAATYPEKKKEIKQLIKEKQLKKNDESSLITLFNFVTRL